MKSALVGAGPAALIAALALRRAGLEVEVYAGETEPAARQALALPPNATRIVRALGLAEPCAACSEKIELTQIRSARRGYVIAWQPRGALLEARYGAPYLETSARAFCRVLRAAAARSRIGLIDSRPAGADAIDADLIVIADAPDPGTSTRASPTPWRLHRGVSPQGAFDVDTFGRAAVWSDPVNYFDHVRIGGELFWRAIVPKASSLESVAAHWAEPIGDLIAAADSVSSFEVLDYEPIESWLGERSILIGDACHPLLPHPRFGEALAIEDGWVLAHMLDVYEDDLAAAAAEFERHRKPRTDRVQAWARRFAGACHPGRRSLWWRRHLGLAAGCRFLPELALERDDWLYGYDAVRHYG